VFLRRTARSIANECYGIRRNGRFGKPYRRYRDSTALCAEQPAGFGLLFDFYRYDLQYVSFHGFIKSYLPG